MYQAEIQVDTYRNLGPKAFLVMILQHIAPSCGLLILSLFLLVAAPFLTTSLSSTSTVDPASLLTLHKTLVSFAYAGIGLFIIAFCIGFVIAWLTYINYRYILHESAIEIEQGILHKDAISIPYRSIQNVDIKRPLIFRLLGVTRLIILTAGSEDMGEKEGESEGIIPIIDKREAIGLREIILNRTHIQEVRHPSFETPQTASES